ncbi:hypothetical protein [Azospirillum doebereinerae]
MAAIGWIGGRLESRRQAARARAIHQHRVNAKKRAWTRDLARLMLVASMLLLAVLAVEIGRKAVTVLNHASAPGTDAVIG